MERRLLRQTHFYFLLIQWQSSTVGLTQCPIQNTTIQNKVTRLHYSTWVEAAAMLQVPPQRSSMGGNLLQLSQEASASITSKQTGLQAALGYQLYSKTSMDIKVESDDKTTAINCKHSISGISFVFPQSNYLGMINGNKKRKYVNLFWYLGLAGYWYLCTES